MDSTTSLDTTGRYHWPKTYPGMEAAILCPHGTNDHMHAGFAYRKCQIDIDGNPEWMAPDTSQCIEVYW